MHDTNIVRFLQARHVNAFLEYKTKKKKTEENERGKDNSDYNGIVWPVSYLCSVHVIFAREGEREMREESEEIRETTKYRTISLPTYVCQLAKCTS